MDISIARDYSYHLTRTMFAQLIFHFTVMHHSIHNFFCCSFDNFTILPIYEGEITRLSYFIFKNTFVIAIWGKNGGNAKFKAKYYGKT